MISLLLDSSNIKLNVGIAKDGVVLDEVSYESWQTQSEHMIPEIDNLMKKYNYTKDDIGEVIVANGPGSYTGLRISITIAKVMAVALNINLVVVSSLQVLKDGIKPSICLMNARSGRSYIGVYENEKVIIKDQIMENADVEKYISLHPEFSICGDTKYLGIEGKQGSIINEMNSIRKYLSPVDDVLSVKPVYLKEEYAVPLH